MWDELNECIDEGSTSKLQLTLENCLISNVPDQSLTSIIRQKIKQLFDEERQVVRSYSNLIGLVFIKLCDISVSVDTNACGLILHLLEHEKTVFCQHASNLTTILCCLIPYEDNTKKESLFIVLKDALFTSTEEKIQEACVRVFDMYSHRFNYGLKELCLAEDELSLLYDLCFHRNFKLREASLGIFVSYVENENLSSYKTYLDQLKRFVPFIEDRTDEIVLSSLLLDGPEDNETMQESTTLYRNFIEGTYLSESVLLFDRESHNTMASIFNNYAFLASPPNYPISDFDYSFEDEDSDVIRHISQRYGLRNSFWLTAMRSRLNKIRYFENIEMESDFLPNVFQLPQ